MGKGQRYPREKTSRCHINDHEYGDGRRDWGQKKSARVRGVGTWAVGQSREEKYHVLRGEACKFLVVPSAALGCRGDVVVGLSIAGRSEGTGLVDVWIGAGGVGWSVTHAKGEGGNDRGRGRGGEGAEARPRGRLEWSYVTAGMKREWLTAVVRGCAVCTAESS